MDCCVAIIKNAKVIRWEKRTSSKSNVRWKRLTWIFWAFIDHNITVNIIENEEIVNKKSLTLPKEITNVIRCKNPRCITSIEQELDHVFILTDPEKEEYRCKYCEEKYHRNRHPFRIRKTGRDYLPFFCNGYELNSVPRGALGVRFYSRNLHFLGSFIQFCFKMLQFVSYLDFLFPPLFI